MKFLQISGSNPGTSLSSFLTFQATFVRAIYALKFASHRTHCDAGGCYSPNLTWSNAYAAAAAGRNWLQRPILKIATQLHNRGGLPLVRSVLVRVTIEFWRSFGEQRVEEIRNGIRLDLYELD